MNSRSPSRRSTQGLAFGALSLALIAAAHAQSAPAARDATIAVFADRYVVGAVAFDDLALVERHVTDTHPRGVALVICGADATRALEAAVHRFRHLPVAMRPADSSDAECRATPPLVIRASQRDGQRPFGIDDAAVDRYWLELMP
jgi:hypothetical protein